MAQEQDREHPSAAAGRCARGTAPQNGAAGRFRWTRAAFRNLPAGRQRRVFSPGGWGGRCALMPAAGTRQMGGYPAGMAQGAVPLDEAAFAAAQPRQNAPQGFSALEDAAARPHSGRAPGAPSHRCPKVAQQPGRPGPGGQGAVPLTRPRWVRGRAAPAGTAGPV